MIYEQFFSGRIKARKLHSFSAKKSKENVAELEKIPVSQFVKAANKVAADIKHLRHTK